MAVERSAAAGQQCAQRTAATKGRNMIADTWGVASRQAKRGSSFQAQALPHLGLPARFGTHDSCCRS